jgi:hypothetical protein
MNRFALICIPFLIAATSAFGQATRTWVSGVGDDANPCSRTAPCKTFAGAIAQTAAGGEISVLDPGGFGALTITKSITISGDGELASVLVAGTNGINVVVNPGDVVILRDLEITGLHGSGLTGVRMTGGGDLHVDRVRILGFSQWGIDAAFGTSVAASTGRLFVNDSTFRNNIYGAVFVEPASSTSVTGSINRTEIVGNGRGLAVYDGASVTLDNSTISGCANWGIATYGASRYSDLSVRNTTISGCTNFGIYANNLTRVRISNTLITNNTNGLLTAGPGTITSYGDNQVYGNTIDGMPTSTASPM